MSSQLPSTLDSGHSTPPSNDEVLVRVEGVSKKFCRSLKKSLWYGVCDIASELNPFGRTAAFANPLKNLTTEDTTERLGRGEEEQTKFGPKGEGVGTTESKSTEGAAGVNQRPDSAEFLEGHSQAGLQMDSEKLASIRSANDSRASGEQTGSDSESVLIRDISGKKSSSGPVTPEASLREGEFFAVKDVSFELCRGECLGLIGHNGAGNQAAGLLLVESYGSERQPLGPRQPGGCTGDCRKAARRVRRVGTSESTLPQVARRVRRRGKARINMALLKMLNGLIKPDSGSITMRGRVASWSMQKTPQANGAHFRSTLGPGPSTPLPINGSVLGFTKKH